MAVDWRAYIAQHDPRLLTTSEGRRVLCELDPLLFALIYLRHHLKGPETGDEISFSAFHLDFYTRAKQWARTDLGTAEVRDCWVAPRGSGKSTLAFLATPLWALAYGHRKFIIALADTGAQAQQHLLTLKRELDTNALLRRDFPELCKPARRPSGDTVSDSQAQYLAQSGVAMVAKGMDSSTLGSKIGAQRPDLMLFDDIEPDESNYSPYQKEKRQDTVISSVFPMNLNAAVCMVGTVTMPGSVIHEIVKQVTSPTDAPEWPGEERIQVHYYPALVTQENGEQVSLWPERWTTEFLMSERHKRSFAKNFLNDPMGKDGLYWTTDDFTYGDTAGVTRVGLFVDPAVTTKKTSDFTGLAVVGHSPSTGQCVVYSATGVKLTGARLRDHVLKLIEQYPRIQRIYVESNQAGDLWLEVFHDMPVKVVTYSATESKEVRFAEALDFYQRRRVLHTHKIATLEEQAVVFPKGANDDVLDAVCAGVLRFLRAPKAVRVTARSASYV